MQANSINPINAEKPSPFSWKNPDNLPPLKDSEIPEHIPLLEEFDIPYIFDIHTHFFPEAVMRAIWQWFDRVNWGISYRESEELRLASLKRNKIFRFTTLNYAHKPDMAKGLNDWVAQNYKNWEGALPFGTFYPEPGVLEYVTKAVEEDGFVGFKLHCEVSQLDLNRSELTETFAYLQRKQIPILIHTGTAPKPGPYTGIQFFRPFIERFSELKVIIAHMGAREIQEYASLLDEFPNLGLDTTMVFVDFLATGEDMDVYFPLLEQYQDKTYFGSDFPNIPYHLAHPISEILNAPISKRAKQKILYQNAEKLFGI